VLKSFAAAGIMRGELARRIGKDAKDTPHPRFQTSRQIAGAHRRLARARQAAGGRRNDGRGGVIFCAGATQPEPIWSASGRANQPAFRALSRILPVLHLGYRIAPQWSRMSKPAIFTISAVWDAGASVWSGHCDEISAAADAPTPDELRAKMAAMALDLSPDNHSGADPASLFLLHSGWIAGGNAALNG
jgi:hypothetical protein